MPSAEIVFICPHWLQSGNVGVLRAKRMVQWLSERNFSISVVCAGSSSRTESAPFGKVIVIHDPLGIYTDGELVTDNNAPPRKPNALRRLLAYLIFSPDLLIGWAFRCRFNSDVRQVCKQAAIILSSSPPESAHVLAGWMSKHYGKPFVMDMRDGWLDEPMKPLLISSAIQRWREARVESRLLRQASRVIVTSDVWKSLLVNRYPAAESRITVVTNAYPAKIHESNTNVSAECSATNELSGSESIHFLHAGRIHSSRPERKLSQMMNPLLEIAKSGKYPSGTITFLGDLVNQEEREIASWVPAFARHGWELIRVGQVAHEQSHEFMNAADILLLLSPSMASIPAKFFDYVSSRKPVICVTGPHSAVFNAASTIPQCMAVDTDMPDIDGLQSFLDACANDQIMAEVPDRFQDHILKKEFIRIIEQLLPR